FLFFFWNISTCSPVIVGGWAGCTVCTVTGGVGGNPAAVACIEPPWAGALTASPVKGATPLVARTRGVGAVRPGSEIVTSPLNDGSMLPKGSSAETAIVKGWPGTRGSGGGVVTTRCVALAACTVTVSLAASARFPESMAAIVWVPFVLR